MIAPQESQAGASDWNDAYWALSIALPPSGFGGSAAKWSAPTMTLDVVAAVVAVAVLGDGAFAAVDDCTTGDCLAEESEPTARADGVGNITWEADRKIA